MADDGQEDLLQAGLLLDVLDGGRGHELLELGEGAVGDDPALVQDRDPVGELLRLVQVLRGEQDGHPLSGQVLDGLPDLQASLRVEPGGGFVQVDHRRVADQAHRDVEPPAHPAGVGGRPASARLGEGEARQQVVRDRPGIGEMTQPGDQDQVLSSGQDLVDRGELSGEADRLADVRGPVGDVEAVDRRAAGVGGQQGGQDPHDRGLARSVGAEQGEDAAPGDLEVHPAQHVQVSIGLLQPPDLDGCRGHRSLAAWSMASISRRRSELIHEPSE